MAVLNCLIFVLLATILIMAVLITVICQLIDSVLGDNDNKLISIIYRKDIELNTFDVWVAGKGVCETAT